MAYKALGRSITKYAAPVWSTNASESNIGKIQRSQNESLRLTVVGPGLVLTSPSFVSNSASHPAGPHGRHAQKVVNRDPIAVGGEVRHNLHSSLSPL